MRILIADDHQTVRKAVRAILESREDAEVCGEAANGQEAVKMAAEFKPELIILDYAMPVLDGLGAASQIRHILPKTPILILSILDEPLVRDAMKLVGARGFVPKAQCADKLLEGVDAVMRGETFFKTDSSSDIGPTFSN